MHWSIRLFAFSLSPLLFIPFFLTYFGLIKYYFILCSIASIGFLTITFYIRISLVPRVVALGITMYTLIPFPFPLVCVLLMLRI